MADIVLDQHFLVCTQQSKAAWQAQERQEILLDSQVDINNYNFDANNPVSPSSDPEHLLYFSDNEKYVQAVFYHYQKMYAISRDTQLWAGLAKLTGGQVYAGLSDDQILRNNTILQNFTQSLMIPDLIDAQLSQIQTILMEGNKNIYQDLAWQCDAYRASGIWALQYANTENKNDLTTSALKNWNTIFDGSCNSNQTQISDGSLGLLEHEQQVILKNPYQELSSIDGHFVSFCFSILVKNPVPGAPRFVTSTPFSSIANFNSRWTWITQNMWPNYLAVTPAQRLSWVQIPLLTRVQSFSVFPWYPV